MKERSGRREGQKRKGGGKETLMEELPKLRAVSFPAQPPSQVPALPTMHADDLLNVLLYSIRS